MATASLTYTRRELRRYARKNGWTIAEAETYFPEKLLCDRLRALKAEFTRLSALDTTEFQEHVDSAHCNALDTCSDEGLPRDSDSLRYWEMAVSTLDCCLDAAGIDTRLPR
jgi:hypothetical protein